MKICQQNLETLLCRVHQVCISFGQNDKKTKVNDYGVILWFETEEIRYPEMSGLHVCEA